MRLNSLALRLTLSSAIVSAVLLAAAAWLLASLFQTALERNFDARLRAVLDGLLANVDVSANGAPVISRELADTRFSLPLSGWYWQVDPPAASKQPPLTSPSLLEKRIEVGAAQMEARDANGVASFYLDDSNGTQLRAIEQELSLPGGQGMYSFLVAGNYDELKSEITAFRTTLWSVLGLLGVGLLLAVLLQVKFAMKPLRLLQERLTSIREGRTEKLEGEFPREIQPVADELNLLIQSNAEIIDRARTQVGNLAHALKTPLSVLTNEAASERGAFAGKVTEQTAIMRDQLSLYLDRARRAARARGLGAVTDVAPVLQALARTLERINRDKNVTVAVDCPPSLKFRGEKQDLEEMAGNLMDNACIWAKAKVRVTAALRREPSGDGRLWFSLKVEDDGPGLPPDKRQEVLQRGKRLDETKPGSGLGLSIVAETAGMYGGTITLSHAALGGLAVELKLPAAA